MRRILQVLPILALLCALSGCPLMEDPPHAPYNLTAATTSATSVQLEWYDMSDNETGFEVESKKADGAFALCAGTAEDAESYTCTGLSPLTQYTFRVRAVGRGGSSSYTNTASATTLASAPNAPGSLIATATGDFSIHLTWTDASSDETGFTVQRSSTSASSGFLQIAAPAANTTSYDSAGLTANTTYWYRVKANGAGGFDSSWSGVASATTSITPPAAPTGLAAAAASSTQINLTWTDTASNESGFALERSTTGASTGFSVVTSSIAANAVSYSDTSCSGGTTYWYRIRATNAGGSSGYSNVASALTLLAAPSGAAAAGASPTSIGLTWTDNSSGETGFAVERSTTGAAGSFAAVATTAANAVSCTDSSGLTVNTLYYYRIKAVGPSGNDSPYTGTVSTRTLLQAPSGVTLSVLSTTSMRIDWTDNSTAESGFRIERSVTDGTSNFTLVTTTSAGVTTYTNTGLTAGTTYWYRVRANASAGNNSLWSNVPSATTSAPIPAPGSLKASAVISTQVHLAWTDNSTTETGFSIEASTTSASTGFSAVATVGANATSYDQTTGITPGQMRWYRVKAVGPVGNDSAWSGVSSVVTSPVGTFKVANSWGIGFTGEKNPDGYYYITYEAMKSAGVMCMFFDDKPAYNPTLLATFTITHARKGDCTVVVGLGTHASPYKTKTFYNYGLTGDALAFPANVMTLDITEFAADINGYDLFLRVLDSAANADTGTITSFTLEKYTTYGGTKTTYTTYTSLPVSTVNGSSVYADIHTAGIVGSAAAPLGMAAASRIDSLFTSHQISDSELSMMKARTGVAVPGRRYNKIVSGNGTGLRPPTEEEWTRLQGTARIVDSPKPTGLFKAVPLIDLSATDFFPPIGSQGSQGSCVSWSTAYYIKSFQEAREHNWSIASAQVDETWPRKPSSMLDRIFSPNFVYHQVNGGADNGSGYTDNAEIICYIGAATWQSYPYVHTDVTSWPSEAAWRSAPPYRGDIPSSAEYGTTYLFYADTDAQITILKTLLENNIPVSISIDADQYATLSTTDVWDTANYTVVETNHANTIVGFFDQ